jgi:hypothetical protein
VIPEGDQKDCSDPEAMLEKLRARFGCCGIKGSDKRSRLSTACEGKVGFNYIPLKMKVP